MFVIYRTIVGNAFRFISQNCSLFLIAQFKVLYIGYSLRNTNLHRSWETYFLEVSSQFYCYPPCFPFCSSFFLHFLCNHGTDSSSSENKHYFHNARGNHFTFSEIEDDNEFKNSE